MNEQKERLDQCYIGDWVRCSDAIEVTEVGDVLYHPSQSHPHRDLNTWKFERRILSRIAQVPPSSGLGWEMDATLKLETFPIWTRVS